MPTVTSRLESETKALGQALARLLRPGDLVLLSGGLGVGKSTLVRSLIQRLAEADIDVPSPTFTLIESYELNISVHHVDLYRLEGPEQVWELGLDDLMESGAVLVEWPERAPYLAKDPHLSVRFEHGADDSRVVTLTASGAGWLDRHADLDDLAGRA